MSTTSDKPAGKIRLLIIDDSQPSRMVQAYVIENEFKDVSVTSLEQPPSMDDILGYDGLILDERLIAESGVELAGRIHRENWRIPMMIMTTLRPADQVFEKAFDVVDYVTTKSDPLMFINVMRAFVRQIRRIKAACPADIQH